MSTDNVLRKSEENLFASILVFKGVCFERGDRFGKWIEKSEDIWEGYRTDILGM